MGSSRALSSRASVVIVRGTPDPPAPAGGAEGDSGGNRGLPESYQRARAVLENYRPHIPIHPDWPMVELSEVCDVRMELTRARNTSRRLSPDHIEEPKERVHRLH